MSISLTSMDYALLQLVKAGYIDDSQVLTNGQGFILSQYKLAAGVVVTPAGVKRCSTIFELSKRTLALDE